VKSDTFATVDGEGPPLVLVHGVGLDHTMWNRVMEPLTASHQVIRYDLLGHGRTPDPPGQRTLDDFVAQLLAVIETHQLARADIAGLSLGGMIALAAAARKPHYVDRLVLLNTVFERSSEQLTSARARLGVAENQGMTAVADLAVNRWFSPRWQAQHPVEIAEVQQGISGTAHAAYLKAYRVFVAGDPLMPEGAASVAATTLAMTGELDPGSTPAMSEALAETIPDGCLRVLPGLHHLPPIEAPDTFACALLDFLDSETNS
jgi:pimeloyl-ACP methyl ester carboxylesterase